MKKRYFHSFDYNTKFVLSILLLALLYYSYRYIFQYNSDSTSPTYKDTPEVFKVGKYVLLLIVYFYFSIAGKYRQERCRNYDQSLEILYLVVIFNCVLLLRALLFQDIEMIKLFVIGLFPLIYYWLYGDSKVNVNKICTWLYWFFLFSVVYETIQISLFVLIGRLPALAYENSISVRFGGPWDDPNGWGIALSFFVPFVLYYKRKGIWKNTLVTIGLLMLIATQSLTAVGSCMVSWSLLYYLINKNRRSLFLLLLAVVLSCSYYFYEMFMSNSFVVDYIEMKQGSMDDHAKSFNIFSRFEWYNYIWGYDEKIFNESDVSNMLCYGGIPLLLIYFSIVLYSIKNLYCLIERKAEDLSFWKSAFSFQIAYLVASINLPCTKMFYLFVMFNIILSVSSFYNYSSGKRVIVKRIKILSLWK